MLQPPEDPSSLTCASGTRLGRMVTTSSSLTCVSGTTVGRMRWGRRGGHWVVQLTSCNRPVKVANIRLVPYGGEMLSTREHLADTTFSCRTTPSPLLPCGPRRHPPAWRLSEVGCGPSQRRKGCPPPENPLSLRHQECSPPENTPERLVPPQRCT